MPAVSVVIPAYNEERHIKKCIESLLTQNFNDIEIIVVDNGSRDHTAQLVEELAKEHPGRVGLIRLDRNLGPGGGRNLGALHANGEILVFVDADMTFPQDYIGKMIEPIRRGEALMTTHLTEYVANTGNPWVKIHGQTVRGQRGRAGEVFRAVKKEFFIRHGGFDPRLHYHDDRTFFYKTGAKAVVVEDAYCYHNNPDTAKEIFRRNYWIGRTYLAIEYHEHGVKGLLRALTITLVRLIDIVALPSIAVWAVLQPVVPILNALLPAPAIVFVASTVRMKIVKVENLRERVVLRTVYAPLYRIIRAAGLLTGILTSLIFGLRVTRRGSIQGS